MACTLVGYTPLLVLIKLKILSQKKNIRFLSIRHTHSSHLRLLKFEVGRRTLQFLSDMDALQLIFFSAGAVVFLLFLLRLRLRLLKLEPTKKKTQHARIPRGASGLPFLGETLAFASAGYSSNPQSFVDRRRSMYGSVFRSHLFGSPMIVSADPDVTRFLLQSDASAFVPAYPPSLMELMGKSSILVLNGALHRRVHGLIGSFLKSPQLKSQLTADMNRYLSSSTCSWQDDHFVLLEHEARQITFQVLAKVLLSLEPGKEVAHLNQLFKTFMAGMISLPVKLPGGQLYRSLQAKKRMEKMVRNILERKRDHRRSSDGDGGGGGSRDVLDALAFNGTDDLTDELICDNLIDLMIPGEETVPILVTLAVKFLTESPAALRQMVEENLLLKERKGGDISWSDYVALQFTQDVISETLRLGNVITGIMRKATRDVEVKGYLIPKGWRVLAYLRTVHLDANIYDDPCVFDPWRWQKKETSGTCHFFPFGGGLRLCPGLDLARLEASIFLHHLVTNFTWVAEPDKVVNFPTVRTRRGLPLRVSRRR